MSSATASTQSHERLHCHLQSDLSQTPPAMTDVEIQLLDGLRDYLATSRALQHSGSQSAPQALSQLIRQLLPRAPVPQVMPRQVCNPLLKRRRRVLPEPHLLFGILLVAARYDASVRLGLGQVIISHSCHGGDKPSINHARMGPISAFFSSAVLLRLECD